MVNRQEIMGCESVDMVRFDLGTLLQGQMRIAKIESAYNPFFFFFFNILLPRCYTVQQNNNT